VKNGERHHIKPRSLFPELSKEKTNIVKLTYREHYICHWLLTKIYPSKEMTNAFWLFHSWNKNKEYFNSYAYEESRSEWAKLNSDMHHLFGEANGMYGRRKELNPRYGVKLTEEQIEKLQIAQQKSYADPKRHEIQIEAVKKGIKTRKFTSSKYYRLKCIETNEVYSSIREVVRKFDFKRGSFMRALEKNRPHHGYTFIKITKEEYAKEAII